MLIKRHGVQDWLGEEIIMIRAGQRQRESEQEEGLLQEVGDEMGIETCGAFSVGVNYCDRAPHALLCGMSTDK